MSGSKPTDSGGGGGLAEAETSEARRSKLVQSEGSKVLAKADWVKALVESMALLMIILRASQQSLLTLGAFSSYAMGAYAEPTLGFYNSS